MNEKLRTLRSKCSFVGAVALSIYLALVIAGCGDVFFLTAGIITATIALTVYAIKCGAEFARDEEFGISLLLMFICIFDIVSCAIQMI